MLVSRSIPVTESHKVGGIQSVFELTLWYIQIKRFYFRATIFCFFDRNYYGNLALPSCIVNHVATLGLEQRPQPANIQASRLGRAVPSRLRYDRLLTKLYQFLSCPVFFCHFFLLASCGYGEIPRLVYPIGEGTG